MAALNKSLKKNLRVMLLVIGVSLIVSNSYALAHTDVTVEQARELIESTNDLVVVDVREQFEYCDAVGHIPGALNYPLSSGVLEARYEELPTESPILVVCQSGARSNVAANFLDSKCFSVVYDMMGGMSAWTWETEPCKDDSDSGTADSAETNTYVFRPDQSTVVQTGGIAGVHETYPIQGQFQLKVDINTTVALFGYIDAFLLSPVSSLPPKSLGKLFNMISLVGEVIDDTTISFTGKADDDSDVLITVNIEDDLAYLVGETIPPPNTADFFLFSLDAVAQIKYSGGTGEPNNPYQIATAEDLMLLGETLEDYDKHFIMINDIDLSTFTGTDFNIIGIDKDDSFVGVFNGNGHVITNFNYTSTDKNCIGFFGYINDPNAQIKDLGLINSNIDGDSGYGIGSLVGVNYGNITNCYIEGGRISGYWDTGGLVGSNYGTITDCYFAGYVSGSNGVGGLVGANYEGTISNCSTRGDVSGEFAVGGLVGDNPAFDIFSAIINCFSSSDISGDKYVGGLVGSSGWSYPGNHFTEIINCYSIGYVFGNENVGGLVGYNLYESGSIIASFWNIESSGQTTSGGGIGLTTAEMQTANTFLEAGWDLVDETENGTDDIWWIDEGQGYPRLWWEPVPEN